MNNKNLLIILYKARDYQKDPDPEHWRTISGAKVHLDNHGDIDGGAGGKFTGNYWDGQKGAQHIIGPHNMIKKNIASGSTKIMATGSGILGGALKHETTKGAPPKTATAAKPKRKYSHQSLPAAYKSKKEQKSNEVIADYISNLPEADEQARVLYDNFGKIVDSSGWQIELTHRGDDGRIIPSNARKYCEVRYPILAKKATKDEIAYAMTVFLHENAHLIDKLLGRRRGVDYLSVDPTYGYPLDKAREKYRGDKFSIGKEATDLIREYGKIRKQQEEDYKKAVENDYQELKNKLDRAKSLLDKNLITNSEYFKMRGKCYDSYKKSVVKMADPPEEYAAIYNFHDLYDALAGGRLLGKTIEGAWISGHGKQYYFSEATRNKELIANWATIKMVSPRMAEIFRKDKPEVAEQLDRILNFMAKMSGE